MTTPPPNKPIGLRVKKAQVKRPETGRPLRVKLVLLSTETAGNGRRTAARNQGADLHKHNNGRKRPETAALPPETDGRHPLTRWRPFRPFGRPSQRKEPMNHLPAALAVLALAVSASNAVWTRRELQRQKAAADFRWKHGRNDLANRLAARKWAEGEHRLGANGHPAGGHR